MAIATSQDRTRILIDRASLLDKMSPSTLERILNAAGLEAEVFTMATSVGVDCRTRDLVKISATLHEAGLI